MENINVIVISGNLTRDPEPRGGGKVAGLRIAVNGRKADEHGNWEDDPNFFNVTLFKKDAENAIKYLTKGREVLIEGRLDWSEYQRDGSKRQSVQIIGRKVTYLRGGEKKEADAQQPADEQPAEQQLAGVGAGGGG